MGLVDRRFARLAYLVRLTVNWPVEHPHDKRACIVCEATPVVLKKTSEPDAGGCARCAAPYLFKEPGPQGLILPRFMSAIPPDLVDLARAAWSKKIKIRFAPFFNDAASTAPTAFEEFLEKHGGEIHKGTEAAEGIVAVEVWSVIDTGHGRGWLRMFPLPDQGDIDGAVEFGEIVLDADELPESTTITITRPHTE